MSNRTTVLLIEDDPDIAEIFDYALTREGFIVLCSGDGLEAVEIAEREKPDVVLLDLLIPTLDGWEVLRRLREKPHGVRPLILIFSGSNKKEDVLRAFETGADDYIRKPARPKEISARIKSALQRVPGEEAAKSLQTALNSCW